MTPPAAAGAAAVPATRPVPARRRPSTRPRNPARARPGGQRRPRSVSAPARRSSRAGALVNSRLLDRGRVWIGLVAFALIGIVAMQLWLLKLNGGIGRAIEHEGLLQRENAVLSAEDSAMSAGDLVEQQARASGMRIVPPGALLFLRTRGSADERMAAARLAQPVRAPAESAAASANTTSASSSTTTTTTTTATTASASTTPSTIPSTTSVQGSRQMSAGLPAVTAEGSGRRKA